MTTRLEHWVEVTTSTFRASIWVEREDAENWGPRRVAFFELGIEMIRRAIGGDVAELGQDLIPGVTSSSSSAAKR